MKKLKGRESTACVCAVIIQQASIMELQQRTDYISLWPGSLPLSWTHADTHFCAMRKRESSLPAFTLCGFKWYGCVWVPAPYYSSLTSHFSSSHCFHPPTPNLPASSLQQKHRDFKRPAGISLPLFAFLPLFSTVRTHSYRETQCVLRVGTSWDGFHSSSPPCIRLTHPNSAISYVC